MKRAQRRARSEVRALALCNPFAHFVTLTLDGARVDRYDMTAITRKLNAWLSNQGAAAGFDIFRIVKRKPPGLAAQGLRPLRRGKVNGAKSN